MVREATKVELTNGTGFPRQLTVADSALTKGTLMVLSDPRTMAAHASANQMFAGVLAMDKEVDGSTSATVWTDGIFKCTASGAITVGWPVGLSAPANYVIAAPTTCSGAAIIGYAMETAATNDTFMVRIRI